MEGERSEQKRYILISDLASETPYSQAYLSLLARRGRIDAKKIGRNWHISPEGLQEYLIKQGIPVFIPKAFPSKSKLRRPLDPNLVFASSMPTPDVFPPDFRRDSPTSGVKPEPSPIPRPAPMPADAEQTQKIEELPPVPPATPDVLPPLGELGAPQHRVLEGEKGEMGPVEEFRVSPEKFFAKKLEAQKRFEDSSTPGVLPSTPGVLPPAPKKEEMIERVERDKGEERGEKEEEGEKKGSELEKTLERFVNVLDKRLSQPRTRIGQTVANLNQLSAATMGRPRQTRWLMVGLVTIIVIGFVFGGFGFGSASALIYKASEFIKDATTLQGHTPGTHANEVLLLDKEGKISIYGHIETKGQLRSYVEQGIAPIVVDSTTTVENLSADYLDNVSAEEFTLAFVTKNGSVTTEKVFLEGGVEVGETLLVKSADKLAQAIIEGNLSTLGSVSIGKDLVVNGFATLAGGADIFTKLLVRGDAEITNLIVAQRGQIKDGGLMVSGHTQLNTLGVSGGASINNLGVGNFNAGGDVFLGNSTADKLVVNASSTFKGTVNLAEDIFVMGSVRFGDADNDNAEFWGTSLGFNSSATTTVGVTTGLNFDSNTLVLDARANRVGIGTSSPGTLLAVQGTGNIQNDLTVGGAIKTNNLATASTTLASGFGTTTPYALLSVEIPADTKLPAFVVHDQGTSSPAFAVFPNNFVGLSTSTPGSLLSVAGVGNFASLTVEDVLKAGIVTATSSILNGPGSTSSPAYSFLSDSNTGITSGGADDYLSLITGGAVRATIDKNGNVGIATTTPAGALGVTGAGIFEGFLQADYFTSTSSNNSWLLGQLGIGTTTPGNRLGVAGSGLIKGNLTAEATSSVSSLIATSTLEVRGASGNDLIVQDGRVGIGTSTAGQLLSVAGTGLFQSNLTAESAFEVQGTATFNAQVWSADITASTGGVDIASAGTRLGVLYADEVNATTLVGTISGGNVSAQTMTINSDNATADTEDSNLAFERGTVTPNALITWHSGNDQLEINTGIFISRAIDSADNAGYGLDVVGAGRFSTDLDIMGGDINLGTGSATSTLTSASALLGVGSTTPWGVLSVEQIASGDENLPSFVVADQGTTTPSFIVMNASGRVGIATSSPQAALAVGGNSLISGDLTIGGALKVSSFIATTTLQVGAGSTSSPAYSFTTDPDTGITSGGADNMLSIITGGTVRGVVDKSGNVGIGTTTPGTLLSIRGASNAGSLTVEGILKAGVLTATSTAILARDGGTVGIGRSPASGYMTDILGSTGNANFRLMGQDGATPRMHFNLADATISNGQETFGFEFNHNDTGDRYALVQVFAQDTTNGGEVGEFRINTLDVGNEAARLAIRGSRVGVASTTPYGLLSVEMTSAVDADNPAFVVGDQGTSTPALLVNYAGNVGIGTTSPSTKFSVGGAAGDTTGHGYFTGGLGVGILNTTANTLRVGQCVTGDTKLRRRRRRRRRISNSQFPISNDDEYIYDEVAIKNVQPGDEILSLNEKTGLLEWQPVRALYDMGEQPVYRIKTASGKTIRTTSSHPYLTKWGWVAVGDLRKGNEIACPIESEGLFGALPRREALARLGLAQDRMQSSQDLLHRGFRQAPQYLANQALVNGNNFAKFYHRWFGQAGIALLGFVETIFNVFGTVLKMRGDRGYDDVALAFVESGGRKNESRPLFGSRQVRKGKRDEYDFAGFISSRRWHRRDYSRSQTTVQQVSTAQCRQDAISRGAADASKTAAVPPAWPVRLPLQFSLKRVWLALRSIITAVFKESSATMWDKIVAIEYTGIEHVWDISVKNTYNFVANGIIAHNTAFIVDSSGSVGVGTINPSQALEVATTGRFGTTLDVGTDLQVYGGDINLGTGSATTTISSSGGNLGIASATPYALLSVEIPADTKLPAFVVQDFGTSTPAFVVTPGGNVGIGTAAPNRELHIVGSSGNIEVFVGETDRGTDFQWDTTNDRALWTTSSYAYPIWIDGSVLALQSQSDGNVGIGTTDPSQVLEVSTTGRFGTTLDVGTDLQVYGGDINLGTGSATSTLTSSGGLLGLASTTPWGLFSIEATTDVNSRTPIFVVGDAGTTTPFLYVSGNNGNVGIGTAGPGYKLHVYDTAASSDSSLGLFQNPTATSRAQITASSHATFSTNMLALMTHGSSFAGANYLSDGSADAGNALLVAQGSGVTKMGVGAYENVPLYLFTNNIRRVTIEGAGNVGIGTTTPGALLSVQGASNVGSLTVEGVLKASTLSATSSIQVGAGSTSSPAYSFTTDPDTGITSGGADNMLSLITGGSVRAVIDKSGNVGIGTAGPSGLLQIGDAEGESTLTLGGWTDSGFLGTNAAFIIEGPASRGVGIHINGNDAGDNFYIGTDPSNGDDADTVAFTVKNSGNVGIGTTTPGALLSVQGASNVGSLTVEGVLKTGAIYATSSASGFATTTPWGVLSVEQIDSGDELLPAFVVGDQGTTTPSLIVMNGTGNVGIGTARPTTGLVINKRVQITGNAPTPTAGAGFEISYASATNLGTIQTFDRDASVYRDMELGGANLIFAIGGTEKMRLASTGNVGIGTTSPGTLLSVQGASNVGSLSVEGVLKAGTLMATSSIQNAAGSTSSPAYSFINDTDTGITSGGGDNMLSLITGGSVRAVIDKSGNVGIGTASPTEKLTISTGTGSDVRMRILGTEDSILPYLRFERTAGTTNTWTFQNPSGSRALNLVSSVGPTFQFDSSGDFQIGNAAVSVPGTFDKAIGVVNTLDTGVSGIALWAQDTSRVPTNPIGAIRFFTGALGAPLEIATIDARITNQSDLNDGNLVFSTIDNGTLSEIMRINSAGNVGIGTTTPGALLSLKGGFLANATSTIEGYGLIANAVFSTSTLGFYTNSNSAPRMQIDTSGNVGIGTAGPSSLFEISSASTHPILTLTATHATDYDPQIKFRTDAAPTVKFSMGVDGADDKFKIFSGDGIGESSEFVIDGSGNVGIGIDSPGRRLAVGGGDVSIYNYGGEILANAGMEGVYEDESGGGGGTVNVAPNWDKYNVETDGTDTLDAETTIIHSGSKSQKIIVDSQSEGIITTANVFESGKSYLVSVWLYATSGSIWVYDSGGGVDFIVSCYPEASWSKCSTTFKASANRKIVIAARTVPTTFFVDDVSVKEITGGNLAVGGLITGAQGTSGLKVDTSGNVGIGTTTPGALLSVQDEANIGALTVEGALKTGSLVATSTTSGFGTTTPYALLSVEIPADTKLPAFTVHDQGTSTPAFAVMPSGNVGIGTAGPGAKLEIKGTSGTGLILDMDNTIQEFKVGGTLVGKIGRGSAVMTGGSTTGISLRSEDTLTFTSGGGAVKMILDNNGNVGIGTTTPGALLSLKGGFLANATSTIEGYGLIANAVFSTSTLGFYTNSNSVPRMQIDTSGNVGIGTARPDSKLHLVSSSRGARIVASPGTAGIWQQVDNDGGSLSLGRETSTGSDYGAVALAGYLIDSGDTLQLGTNNTPRVTISSGNVGIGTTTPGTLLSVQGASNVGSLTVEGILKAGTLMATSSIQNAAGSTSSPAYSFTTDTDTGITSGGADNMLSLITGGSVRAVIDKSGNVGIGTTNPSSALHVQGTSAGATLDVVQVRNTGTTANTGVGILLRSMVGADNADARILAVGLGATGAETRLEFQTEDVSPGLQTRMVIAPSGNVGIASTTPRARLGIEGASTTPALLIRAGNTTGDGAIAISVASADLCDDNGTPAACALNDIAELFLAEAGIEAGDVVAFASPESFSNTLESISNTTASPSGRLVRARAGDALAGVISTAPAIVIEGNRTLALSGFYSRGSGKAPLAIAGRVPVKIASSSPAISTGDFLTVSADAPGLAAKATEAGYAIGKALEAYDPSNPPAGGKISMFVNLTWFAGESVQLAGSPESFSNVTESISNSGSIRGNSGWIREGLANLWSVAKSTLASIANTLYTAANSVLAASTQLIVGSEDAETITYETYNLQSTREELIASGSATLVMMPGSSNAVVHARIKFDESFTSLIDESEPIKVIVTPTTKLNGGLYVHEKTIYGFEVREINAQDEGGMFDWIVIAKTYGDAVSLESFSNTLESVSNTTTDINTNVPSTMLGAGTNPDTNDTNTNPEPISPISPIGPIEPVEAATVTTTTESAPTETATTTEPAPVEETATATTTDSAATPELTPEPVVEPEPEPTPVPAPISEPAPEPVTEPAPATEPTATTTVITAE